MNVQKVIQIPLPINHRRTLSEWRLRLRFTFCTLATQLCISLWFFFILFESNNKTPVINFFDVYIVQGNSFQRNIVPLWNAYCGELREKYFAISHHGCHIAHTCNVWGSNGGSINTNHESCIFHKDLNLKRSDIWLKFFLNSSNRNNVRKKAFLSYLFSIWWRPS